jgi:hypothetical protein
MYPVLKDVLAAPDDRKVRDGGRGRGRWRKIERDRKR